MTEVLDLIGEELLRASRTYSERLARRTPWRRVLRPLTIAAAVCAPLLGLFVSGGGAPSAVAQAFPILASTKPIFGVTPVRARRSRGAYVPHEAGELEDAIVRDVRSRAPSHPFPPPYSGRGYVVESADGRWIGVYYVTTARVGGLRGKAALGVGPEIGFAGAEARTAQAERRGLLYSSSARGTADLYIALVPTGGTLDATYRGRVRRLVVREGVAAGVAPSGTVLSIHVGHVTQRLHLRRFGR